MSLRIVAPEVVMPDTLSNQAFERVNSPPQRAYGIIPNRQASTHDRRMITTPSRVLISACLRDTNTMGKIPQQKVRMPLRSSG